MLHIINNFICYYDIKNNIHFMELLYSDMIYVIMFIEGASETERNRIQGHWRKLGGILVKSIHLEKMMLTYKYFFAKRKITNLGILERKKNINQ